MPRKIVGLITLQLQAAEKFLCCFY